MTGNVTRWPADLDRRRLNPPSTRWRPNVGTKTGRRVGTITPSSPSRLYGFMYSGAILEEAFRILPCTGASVRRNARRSLPERTMTFYAPVPLLPPVCPGLVSQRNRGARFIYLQESCGGSVATFGETVKVYAITVGSALKSDHRRNEGMQRHGAAVR
jgi:hypothetical protein